MIARIDAAARIAGTDDELVKEVDLDRLLDARGAESPTLAERTAARLLHRPLGEEPRAAVASLLDDTAADRRAARAVAGVLSLPEASIG